MPGRLLLCILAVAALWVPAPAVETTAPPAPVVTAAVTVDPVDRDVALFNPDIYSLDAQGNPVHATKSAFLDPASEIAREMVWVTWFTSLVFLPFLVLPLVLLLYVVFKYRDTGDGRQPATFTGNHKLEVIWTLIPCVALLIVSLPTWAILRDAEAPPVSKKDNMTVTVIGKQFAWDYLYKGMFKDPKAEEKQEIGIGQFMGIQEPLVLARGRTVQIHMTSDDVNHAWWVPAFGVKKDCIKGRFTYAWFTPDLVGVFKGQCAELCGANHGIMIVSAVVVEKPDFERFIALQRAKDDTLRVWSAVQPPPGTAIDDKALREAVAGYLARGRSAERQYALRYWIANNYSTLLRVPPSKGVSMGEVVGLPEATYDQAKVAQAIRARRAKIDALLAELVAGPIDSVPSAAVAVHANAAGAQR
jgi:cytochrome c oxidase subunit 2